MTSEPQAGTAPAADAAASEVDWLSVCRRAVEAQRALFADVTGIRKRTDYEGVGKGGDHTLVIDARAEDLFFAELDKEAEAGASFIAISEERGEISFGDGGPTHVVIDPIDGSLNARRMIPSHSLSVAVASGPTMADVDFGYVYDFGAGEEFVAVRGEGATSDGDRLEVAPESEQLELVGLEAARPEKTVAALSAMKDHVYRLRIIGSIAITGAYVAAGRLDGMLNLRNCRSVDAAACQLIVREAGGAVSFGGGELSDAGLDLDARYPIAAASTEQGLQHLLEFQRSVEIEQA